MADEKSKKSIFFVAKNAFFMMLGTLTSRILGLVREMVIAWCFGASYCLDAFWVAYTIPNTLRYLLAEGALSAAFVPVFSRVYHNKGVKEAVSLANNVLFFVIAVSLLLSVIGILFSFKIVSLLAPGFDERTYKVAVYLSKLVFPYIVFMSVASVIMGVLNSVGYFFVPAVSPAVSNVVVIVSVLVLSFYLKFGILGLVFGVMAGGFVQWFVQYLFALNRGLRLFPIPPQRDNPYLKEIWKTFLPYAFGASLSQMGIIVDRFLASFLAAGSISVLSYAFRLLQLPLGLFVVGISQAILPVLSVETSQQRFKEVFSDGIKLILLVSVPSALGLILLSKNIVHLLFFGGAFDEVALYGTTLSLILYSLGIPFMAVYFIVIRAFYARGDVVSPIKCTFCGVVLNGSLSFILMQFFSFGGIALATSIANAFSCVFSLRLLRWKRLPIPDKKWWLKFALLILFSFLPVFSAPLFADRITASGKLVEFSFIFVLIVLVLFLYLFLGNLFKIKEVEIVLFFITEKLSKKGE